MFFNFDETYRLVWESDRSARHSEFITANPRIAVVVVGGLAAGDEAVYLECTAAAVPEDRLAETLAVFLGGPHRPQEPKAREVRHYQGGASLALYEAVPEHVYVLDITHDEAGLRHDRRREIDLRSGP